MFWKAGFLSKRNAISSFPHNSTILQRIPATFVLKMRSDFYCTTASHRPSVRFIFINDIQNFIVDFLTVCYTFTELQKVLNVNDVSCYSYTISNAMHRPPCFANRRKLSASSASTLKILLKTSSRFPFMIVDVSVAGLRNAFRCQITSLSCECSSNRW